MEKRAGQGKGGRPGKRALPSRADTVSRLVAGGIFVWAGNGIAMESESKSVWWYGQMDGWTDGRVDGWSNGELDGYSYVYVCWLCGVCARSR